MVILVQTQGISDPILKASLRAASSRRFEKDPRRAGRCGTVVPAALGSVWFLGTMLACLLMQARCWLQLKTLISEQITGDGKTTAH